MKFEHFGTVKVKEESPTSQSFRSCPGQTFSIASVLEDTSDTRNLLFSSDTVRQLSAENIVSLQNFFKLSYYHGEEFSCLGSLPELRLMTRASEIILLCFHDNDLPP